MRHFMTASVAGLALGAGPAAFGQIVTQDLSEGITSLDLVQTILGESIPIGVVSYSGSVVAAGIFEGGTGIFGFESGIILSSGNIANVIGPNSADDISAANGTLGDPDLDDLIPGFETQDAAVLQFDFECETLLEISFQYVFSSDEYNEYVNSAYNDVFGFFVNGVNVALLPDNVTVVAINNVNGGNPAECGDGIDNDDDGFVDGADPDCNVAGDNVVGEGNSNSIFYINNDCSDPDGGDPCPIDTEMDGFTVVLSVSAAVNPGVNHIKLAIADAGDMNLDSNVLIKAGSFKCAPPDLDCNENGVPDDLDILKGTSQDCNDNGIPDECDIADGTSGDLNENGIPDECEPDCNMNGVPDDLDILNGTSNDFNEDGVPDECQEEIDFGEVFNFGGVDGPNREAIGDMNGDMSPDVVTIIPAEDSMAAGQVVVFLNQGVDGGGAWQGLVPLAGVDVGLEPSAVAVGRFNGDDFLDVAVTNAGDDTVSILFNAGDGTLGPPDDFPVGGRPSGVDTADFDEDGDVDLTVTNEADQTIIFLYNDGNGVFTQGAGGAGGGFNLGLSPTGVFADDYDDDKCPDAAGSGNVGAAAGGGGQVFVLLGLGGGQFEEPAFYDVGMFPTDIASGDVNGDNVSDIIASNSGDGTISVLLNLGDGTFAEAIHFDVGSMPLSVDMVDLNGDGDRDVAVVADDPEIGPSVQVLANTLETGEFDLGEVQVFSVQATPNFVASGDMNVDGIGDLVTVNGGGEEDGSVSALLSDPQTVAFPASLDIRPGGCPNPLNPKSNGVVPVGLLGRKDFNAKAVDLATLRLERPAIVGSVVFPAASHTQIKDVGTPFPGDPCDCHALGGDGLDDVSMKFSTPEVAEQFELAGVPGGSMVELELRGNLLDGTPFVATDCVRIVPSGPGIGHGDGDAQQTSAGPGLGDVLDAWGPCGGECAGDLDGDGSVGIRDVMIWISGAE